MAAPARQRTPAKRAHPFDPQEYAAFIRQIELVHVWLDEANLANHHGPNAPEHAAVQIESSTSYESWEAGFQAIQSYEVQMVEGEKVLADIEVRFGLRFTSKEEMTEERFAVFREVNLPVNTWPYLREFVSTTLGRMGWQPITLPTLKRGTDPPRRAAKEQTRTAASRIARRAAQQPRT